MLYLFQGKIRGKKKNVGDQRREKGVKEGEGWPEVHVDELGIAWRNKDDGRVLWRERENELNGSSRVSNKLRG